VKTGTMSSINCSQAAERGDGKRGTPREVKHNDGGGKERLKEL